MRVAVIGAGIVGVTSAFELACDGHDVTVFERHSSLAAEASFATTGVIAPAFVTPWAGPAMSGRVLRELFTRRGGMRLPLLPEAAHWRWLWRWAQSAEAAQARQLRLALLGLSRYSYARTRELSDNLQLGFERAAGLLILLRTPAELAATQPHLALLAQLGIGHTVLDAAGCHAVEPGLGREQAIAGGVRLAEGEVANCRQFAHVLRDAAEQRGVDFRFATAVKSLEVGSARDGTRLQLEQLALTTGFASSHASGVVGAVPPMQHGSHTPHGPHASITTRRALAAARYLEPMAAEAFDAIVICAGAETALLPSLGLRLPLQAVHGYSLTAPLRAPDRGPRGAVVDDRHGVVISRLGQRVRIAGGVEFGGAADRHRRAPVDLLFKLLHAWFPGAAHTAKPQVWKGARPMLADGAPLIGRSPRPGVWLNIGHGASGWALACGSARLLADQISGREPALDTAPFSTARYPRHLAEPARV